LQDKKAARVQSAHSTSLSNLPMDSNDVIKREMLTIESAVVDSCPKQRRQSAFFAVTKVQHGTCLARTKNAGSLACHIDVSRGCL